MEIRKERSIVKVYDGEILRGGWDILNNTFIGCKGQLLKGESKPMLNELEKASRENMEAKALYEIITGRKVVPENWGWEKVAPRIEALVSVGLSIASYNWNTWRYLTSDNQPALNKSLVSYLKEYCDYIYSEKNIKRYQIFNQYNKFLQTFNKGQISWVLDACAKVTTAEYNIPIDWTMKMCVQAIHEKVDFQKDYSEFGSMLIEWYRIINTLQDTLEVKRNILTNYCILEWSLENYKSLHYDEALEQFNNQPWLHFETDKFVAYPLTTKEQFHQEAVYQHNCVERLYMEQVFERKTHIVVIRKKSNPNTPYITCEVDITNHKIEQYLTRFNVRPADNGDVDATDFYYEYQKFLLSSLSE